MRKTVLFSFVATLLVITEATPSRRNSCRGSFCKGRDLTRSGNVCLLPQVVGPCEALIPRFFYNTTSKTCEKFNYGGCQGNGNNFITMEECENKCNWTDSTCVLPPDAGPCDGFFEIFFYNATSRTCEKFVYGGCGGNENNFRTKEDCLKRC